MNKHIARKNDNNKHSLIILFVEDKLSNYKSKEDKYLFWFNASPKSDYSINAVLDVIICFCGPHSYFKENLRNISPFKSF